jgi:hypothetical protein
MSDSGNAYAVVIADLRRQRDEIERMIARLEAMAASGTVCLEPDDREQTQQETPRGQDAAGDRENPYLGMKSIDAVKDLLARRRKPLAPAEILAGLEAGGLSLSGANVVASILSRRQRDVGDVVSPKRGVWGLREWYPGRTFPKKQATDADKVEAPAEDASLSTEPGQPDVTHLIFPLRSSDQP